MKEDVDRWQALRRDLDDLVDLYTLACEEGDEAQLRKWNEILEALTSA